MQSIWNSFSFGSMEHILPLMAIFVIGFSTGYVPSSRSPPHEATEPGYIVPQFTVLNNEQTYKIKNKVQAIGSTYPVFVRIMKPCDVNGKYCIMVSHHCSVQCQIHLYGICSIRFRSQNRKTFHESNCRVGKLSLECCNLFFWLYCYFFLKLYCHLTLDFLNAIRDSVQPMIENTFNMDMTL